MLPALGAGTAAGVGAGTAAAAGYRSLTRVRTDATPTVRDLVGVEGQVVTAIAESGYGEVVVRLGGSPTKLSAQGRRPGRARHAGLGVGGRVPRRPCACGRSTPSGPGTPPAG